MPVDEKDVPLKLLNGPDKKTPEVFDYRLYLQKHEKFHDLTVDDDGHTIRCRVCEVVVIKLTHLTKEPKLATIEKHVASKVHREKLSPKDKAFKPSCVLCPMCNKYVSMKNYKRHLTLPTHIAMEEEHKKEDLSALSAEEANQKLLDKMKDAMLTSGVSGSTLKKLIPFLREYCVGGGAIPSRRNGQIALGDAHASDDDSVHGHVQIVHK